MHQSRKASVGVTLRALASPPKTIADELAAHSLIVRPCERGYLAELLLNPFLFAGLHTTSHSQ